MSLWSIMKRKFFTVDVRLLEPFKLLKMNSSRQVVYGALFACLASIIQTAGIFGGFGLLISAFSTLPIIMASVLSKKMGFLTYLVASFLIGVIQPSEFFSFPLTTGLLGFIMGLAFRSGRNGIFISIITGISLSLGIFFILYVIQFPILGPGIASTFSIWIVLIVVLFSVAYSWIWTILFIHFLKIMRNLLKKGGRK